MRFKANRCRDALNAMARSLYLLSSIFVLLSLGCTTTNSEHGQNEIMAALTHSDLVFAEVSDSQLVILNETRYKIFYTAFPRDVLPVILWAPCVDPPRCKSIMPGRSAVLPFSEFMMESRDDEVVVFWWHLVRQPDGTYKHDEIRSIIVKL